MRRVLVMMMGALLAEPAGAQQAAPAMPDWDARGHCDQQQRVLAMESAAVLNACLRMEDRAQDQLRRAWDTVPAASRRHCIQQQRVLNMTSYSTLNACIEMERRALQEIERRPAR
jgi:hypothetical protein